MVKRDVFCADSDDAICVSYSGRGDCGAVTMCFVGRLVLCLFCLVTDSERAGSSRRGVGVQS